MASLSGALSGGLSGAGIGSSVLPGIGTAVGAGIGGLLGLFGGGGGKKPKLKPYSKQSLGSLEDIASGQGLAGSPLYGAGSSFLQQLLSGNPEAFAAFEAPYLQNFQQKIAPGIAERFAGAGTGAGALGSSAFANSLAEASRNLQTDLASLRSGLQMQALPQALGYAQAPISNRLQASQLIPGQFYEQPGQSGFFENALPSLAPSGFSAFADLFSRGLGRPGV